MRIPKDMFIGSIHSTNNCGDIEVRDYNGCELVSYVFTDTYSEGVATSDSIRKGQVKDRMKPSVFGVGFVGYGIYKPYIRKGKPSEAYSCWKHVLERCYSDDFHKKNPSYLMCEVCEEWQDFQCFAEFYYRTYPKDGSKYELDKDMIVSGNKLYSEDMCTWLTKR